MYKLPSPPLKLASVHRPSSTSVTRWIPSLVATPSGVTRLTTESARAGADRVRRLAGCAGRTGRTVCGVQGVQGVQGAASRTALADGGDACLSEELISKPLAHERRVLDGCVELQPLVTKEALARILNVKLELVRQLPSRRVWGMCMCMCMQDNCHPAACGACACACACKTTAIPPRVGHVRASTRVSRRASEWDKQASRQRG